MVLNWKFPFEGKLDEEAQYKIIDAGISMLGFEIEEFSFQNDEILISPKLGRYKLLYSFRRSVWDVKIFTHDNNLHFKWRFHNIYFTAGFLALILAFFFQHIIIFPLAFLTLTSIFVLWKFIGSFSAKKMIRYKLIQSGVLTKKN
jgi:hypothetical protein